MAVIPAQRVTNPRTGEVEVYLWETLTENDTAEAVVLPNKSDKSVHMTGSFGNGNVGMEGSNDPDGAAYAVLHDPQGNDLELTAAGIEAVLENVYLIRPRTPTGTSVDVDVRLLAG